MIRQLIKNSIALMRWGSKYAYDELPPEIVREVALKVPIVRENLIKFSIDEYDRNPYYKSVIDNLGSHTLGPCPSIIAMSDNTIWDDNLEDAYSDWTRDNKIGLVFREIRKQAALTGLGIAIPYTQETLNPIKLRYKVYGANCLRNPSDAQPKDRIFNGIQYDSNWEPIKFFLIDNDEELRYPKQVKYNTKEYTIEEVLYYSQGYRDGILTPLPECLSAFTIYPFIRRFLQAAIEGEEFRASHPMALEVDATIYSPKNKNDPPTGQFKYEPRTIKTLPPGTKLAGIPFGMAPGDQAKLIKLFAATCALSVQMPANIALGDSQDSNMASAQVDVQPWANKVDIDRFDLEPTLRKAFKEWYTMALLKAGVFSQRALMQRAYPTMFPHLYVYPDIHSHPDPTKRANARKIDLGAGATTLNRIYSKMGMNARRELQRDAKLFNIPFDEYMKIRLASSSPQAATLLQEPEEDDVEDKERSNDAA